MVKPNYPESAYILLEELPTLIVTPLLAVVVVILYICYRALSCSEKVRTCCELMLKGIIKLAKVFFGTPTGLFHKREATEEEDAVYIGNKEVPYGILIRLGVYVISFSLFALIVFWDIFLIKQSNSCDDTTIDCFVNTTAEGELITNCSQYAELTNITITCYKFVFDYGSALSAVGGLLTMIKITMKIIAAAFLALYGSIGQRCGHKVRLCPLIFHMILVLLIPIAIPIATIILISTSSLFHFSLAIIFRVILFLFTILIGCTIPWYNYANFNVGSNPEFEEI